MIVISGALVLVALVLLIFGITTTDLDFVYASIVVSLVSFVFLLVGILQRRGDRGSDVAPPAASSASSAVAEQPAAAEVEPVDEGVHAVVPRVRTPARGSTRMAAPVVEAEEPQTEELDVLDDAELAEGTVLVVPGRPRYHVSGCRYLTGKSATEVDVGDARDEGFSPCGVCKPDDALAAASVDAPTAELVVEDDLIEDDLVAPEPVEDTAGDEDQVIEDVPGAVELEPVAAAAPARRSRSTAAAKKAPAKKAPAKRAPRTPRSEPSAAAVAASADPSSDAVLEAVAGEAPAAAPAAAASDGAATAPAKSASRRTTTVVIIPDRGKFHRSECRYVRNAEGTSTLSRTAATKQGYDACGVCKP